MYQSARLFLVGVFYSRYALNVDSIVHILESRGDIFVSHGSHVFQHSFVVYQAAENWNDRSKFKVQVTRAVCHPSSTYILRTECFRMGRINDFDSL